MKTKLEQIEADVVFVGKNLGCDKVHVLPQWECDMGKDALQQTAVTLGLQWAEADGCGEVMVEIFDYRK
jgi:hypothetical protein